MYPTISFKRSLIYTAVLTAFTVPFSHAVFAEEAADPTQNSDIQLIQSNQSNVDDRNKADNLAYIRSQGQGGMVLKGADASGIVQQIMPGLVNRGNPSDYLSNVLDLTVNNDNVDSQNTFYISQIGGSWLVMNVDGENNTVRIADLAGIGFEKANAQDMTTDDAQAPAQATNINITGDYNELTLTPNIIGNIARKMQVTMDEGEGLNQYNVINISYSDFSDIVTKLSNASYSTIDVTQTDFTGDVDDVSSNPNIVFIDVMDADNTKVVLNQTGLGNEARLNVTNDFNTINLTQNNQIGALSNRTDINVDGYKNTVTATQIIKSDQLNSQEIDIDVVNGENNTISVTQITNNDYLFEKSIATVYVSGSDNVVDINQSQPENDYYYEQRNKIEIFGDDNEFTLGGGFNWNDLDSLVKGDLNIIDLQKDSSWGEIWGRIEVLGEQNRISANIEDGYVGFNGTKLDGLGNVLDIKLDHSYLNLGGVSLKGKRNIFALHSLYSSSEQYADVTGNNNRILYKSNLDSKNSDFWYNHDYVTTVINGDLNVLDIEVNTRDSKDYYYDLYKRINTTVDGSFNRVILSLESTASDTYYQDIYNTKIVGKYNSLIVNNYSMSNVDFDFNISGRENSIVYTSDTDHSVAQIADIDVIGDHNRLLFNPSISNSTYSVIGDDNYLSMTGHADELSSSIMSISGNDNTIDMDVAGLNGAVNINFTGDNNVMDFVLWAGDLDYTLTGSDFIGAVKTVGSAYYQQIERLGTGSINMQTAAGVVNISSNCGQACGNAI